jgi:RNA polymerase sigma-70 factor, ECF subfamily
VDSSSPTEQLLGEVAFVHRLARALLNDAELAHDVAQDALAAALQQGPVQHVRGWLAAVTKHLAARTRRAARERASREAFAARPPAHDGEERTGERLRLHRRLTDAVMALPEPYRTAVTLRCFDDLSPRAIAGRLRLPAATVRQHVHRGLAMLRGKLDGEFGGRDRWQAAFAAVGLGKVAVSVLFWIPVLAMKKVAVVFLVAAVAAGWWAIDRGEPAPVVAPMASAPPPSTAAIAAANAKNDAAPAESVRAAVPAATTPDATFVVRLVDEREQPIAGADVHRWTAAGEVAKQRTDRDGRAEFAPRDGGGGVVVIANGWSPIVRELDHLRGEQRYTLTDGTVLDGTLLVDETPGPAGLRLGVFAPLVLPESAPRELRESWPKHRPSAVAVTGPGGTFVFRGLAADRAVTLELPSTHWFVPKSDVVDLVRHSFSAQSVQPARGVLLRTTQLPTVSGRVVWADDGHAVSSPLLSVIAKFEDGENSPGLGVHGHEDGTFAAGFYPSSSSKMLPWLQPAQRRRITSVQIWAEAAGSDGSVTVDFDDKALEAMAVVVRLPRATVTHFVVTDLDDRPIAGARVSATPSTVTDEHGCGTFQGKRDKVLVGADGRQVQPAVSHRPAAGTAADPLRFRLAPRNHLVLQLRTADRGVPQIRWVRIRSTSSLFQGARFHNSFDQTFGGSDADCTSSARMQPDGSRVTYRWDCTVRPDANGRIELHSLEPGVECTATANDALDTPVATATFVTPPAGETRAADLIVNGIARNVHGRVQTRDGAPVTNAKVELRHGNRKTEAGVDASGAFVFEGIYVGDGMELYAKAGGYAAASRELTNTNTSDDPGIVLVLERGQRVTVRIVDESDQPVAAPVFAEVEGDDLNGQNTSPGEHVFSDLPAGVVTFVSPFGGSRFTIRHDTVNPTAVLRVPRPARLQVTAQDSKLGARVTRLDVAGEPFTALLGESETRTQLLVPGRYRVELVQYSWRGEGEQRERVVEVVAPAQEIDAKAGELVRVKF